MLLLACFIAVPSLGAILTVIFPSLEHEEFIARYPITEFPVDAIHRRLYGASRVRTLPALIDRFDWIVGFSPNVEAPGYGAVNRHSHEDPRTVLASPQSIQKLLSLAEEHLETGRSGRLVVFMGSVLYLSEAFGHDEAERMATLARLEAFFERILYGVRDIDLGGVKTMPLGLNEQYYRGTSPAFVAAIAAAGVDGASKPRRILAGVGRSKTNPFPLLEPHLERFVNTSSFIHLHQRKHGGRGKGFVAALASRAQLSRWLETAAAWEAGVERRSIAQRLWYAELSTYRFLLAPLGDGIHTPKMIESLLLLTVPVVQRGPFPVFDDYMRFGFPIVVIDEWDEVTSASLETWWQTLSPRLQSFRDNCLTADAYWHVVTGMAASCH